MATSGTGDTPELTTMTDNSSLAQEENNQNGAGESSGEEVTFEEYFLHSARFGDVDGL